MTPLFTADEMSLVATDEPDLLLAEYATVATMTTVKELTHLPLVMTAWATEPGSAGFFPDGYWELLGRARSGHGLAPLSGSLPIEHWITFTPPAWGRTQVEPQTSTLRARLTSTCTGTWSAPDCPGPFVYGTVGTVFNTRRRLATLIDAIGLGGRSGLVTVGANMNPDDFAAAPSVTVERFVPQADVLEHADVMLCHGGLGSVLGAIETATPMVIVPLGVAQLVNAEIAEQLGIATVVDPAAAGPEELCDAISGVLASAAHLHGTLRRGHVNGCDRRHRRIIRRNIATLTRTTSPAVCAAPPHRTYRGEANVSQRISRVPDRRLRVLLARGIELSGSDVERRSAQTSPVVA